MDNDHLYVALIQADLVWENPDANRKQFDDLFLQISEETELIVLPEMFATGFSMNVELCAESMDGSTIDWLKSSAKNLNKVIVGSLMVRENEKFYNRFVFVKPDQTIEYYDKRHLFSMGGEHLHFTPGVERKVFQLKSFRILPQICYDLRFPVFSRNQNDYDLMINCANWPAPRQHVWDTLLKARAIENQAYVVGVNRIGKDDNGINYTGGSVILDAKGKEIVMAGSDHKIISAKLSTISLQNFRSRFPVLGDSDSFIIQN